MRLSTRNQLPGTITSIHLGEVTAIVKVALNGGGQLITSSITRDAAEDLCLAEGTAVTVLVKASEVMLAVENESGHHPSPGSRYRDSSSLNHQEMTWVSAGELTSGPSLQVIRRSPRRFRCHNALSSRHFARSSSRTAPAARWSANGIGMR
jgi:molybdopterin-binding protein